MQPFGFEATEIEGLTIVNVFRADDVRGYLLKDYSEEIFAQNNITHDLKEVFYTSSHKNVIRAIHFQRTIQQPKLIRCVKGKVFDIVVDLRKASATFGQWRGFWLTEDCGKEILIPGGCGHGYLVLEDSIVSYKCAEKFVGEYDDGIMWNDPDINVEWPVDMLDGEMIIADKDKNLQSFQEFKARYGGLK